jgi:hypothetical protein
MKNVLAGSTYAACFSQCLLPIDNALAITVHVHGQ